MWRSRGLKSWNGRLLGLSAWTSLWALPTYTLITHKYQNSPFPHPYTPPTLPSLPPPTPPSHLPPLPLLSFPTSPSNSPNSPTRLLPKNFLPHSTPRGGPSTTIEEGFFFVSHAERTAEDKRHAHRA